MKKFQKIGALVLTASLLISVVGCSSSSSSKSTASDDKKTIIVGDTPVPATEVLKKIEPILAKKGYKLQIKEFTDYVTPNTALANKEIDANLYQHIPYLENFNKQKHTDLTYTAKVFIAPMAVYSKKVKKLDELRNGAVIAVPNDPTNEARALKLLQKAGLIKLKGNDTVTKIDITENKKNIQIKELDAPQLPRALNDVDASVINTNYALQANLNPTKNSIYTEDKTSSYVNILAVRKEDKDKPYIKALSEALNSPELKKFIQEKYKGTLIPTF
ncbi:MetQ/NlpA family ABC transporter substrate-binding protein [Clostridium fermenticellae]|uniref:Lipoprotein n=1 Tax=Clostridium fermenticellae TaxID=2068654 RepID=A0A386H3J8_9CLOT|nr:MetQ/NlpA family ABC transporter substrate-binding protein [Clostridium fermenticellae]AYD40158.1 MetQ/NlpA family ABC transporter substrate-binding protein [Clostridium fermenticellae]